MSRIDWAREIASSIAIFIGTSLWALVIFYFAGLL